MSNKNQPSLFARIFGTGSKNKPPTPQEAIQRIRDIEELLSKKSEFLEKKIDQELEVAKKYGTKNKRQALMALKRKKRYEAQLTTIDGTLTTLEYQRENLENAHTNVEVVRVMSDAAKAFKNANQFSPDEIHDMMDDIAEQQELSNEISQAISNPIGFQNEFDDDELLKELEGLEETEVEEQLLNIPRPSDSIPVSKDSKVKPSSKAKDDDDELRQLEQWTS